jgi:erythronate-4-phosphate dehydrogenase
VHPFISSFAFEIRENHSIDVFSRPSVPDAFVENPDSRQSPCFQIRPGCNSASVAQYIQSSLLVWKSCRNKKLNELTIGIIGVGNVGSKVAKVARDFGMRVLLNDLPREEKEGTEQFASLSKIAEECDIITFHVPLYKEGKYKTFHLADENFFQSLKRKPVIINTSRGEVIDTDALLKALDRRIISDAIIDVWEHEPEINRELLEKAFIGTKSR